MRILWPMFVYCHLELVNRDEGHVAREFHRRFGPDHILLHEEDVRALAGLATPAHAESDATARKFRDNRIPISCCQYTFQGNYSSPVCFVFFPSHNKIWKAVLPTIRVKHVGSKHFNGFFEATKSSPSNHRSKPQWLCPKADNSDSWTCKIAIHSYAKTTLNLVFS